MDSWTGGPADGGSYYFGLVPAAPTCDGSDAISGIDTCVVSGYQATVGPHTLTATATDKAARTATDTRTYTVLAWTLRGFYQPTDMSGVLNVVKNGSTVPLKFEIFAGSTELTDTAAVKSLTSAKVNCDATAPMDDVELTATGGTSLRYDLTAGQFVYNWQTPKTAGQCYRVTMTTQDGTSLAALFKLK
ncbi:MAG TPA: PxKF domain-containing protein [Gaiellaceae bacterium]|nr:PxKF domain-containing protein [Gaiellaceae bacterium]